MISGWLLSMKLYRPSLEGSRTFSTGTSSRKPLTAANKIRPRARTHRRVLRLLEQLRDARGRARAGARVAASRSLVPNWANACSSRNCASSSLSEPATWRIACVWAEPPTRDTERPTLIAGRMTGVEQVGLKENLAVGDRDHVRRDVGRDVVGLRLDDRQRRQRAAAVARRRERAARSSRRLCR